MIKIVEGPSHEDLLAFLEGLQSALGGVIQHSENLQFKNELGFQVYRPLKNLIKNHKIKFEWIKEVQKQQKEKKEGLRVWCTNCDVDMEYTGVALDCPTNGKFYVCPECNYRIVTFEGEEK